MGNEMKYIFYGDMEVKYAYLEKQAKNYSNGSASQFRTLTIKQFEKESKRLQKELEKRKNKK